MLGSKRQRRRWRKLESKGPYWQGWVYPTSKATRNKLKQLGDISDGGSYRKIGIWFYWN